MAKFWEIKEKGYLSAAMDLQKVLPALKNSSASDIADDLKGSGLVILRERSVVRPFWIRFTLPFALLLFVLLFVAMPINFLFTGIWGYQWKWLTNWFRSLGW